MKGKVIFDGNFDVDQRFVLTCCRIVSKRWNQNWLKGRIEKLAVGKYLFKINKDEIGLVESNTNGNVKVTAYNLAPGDYFYNCKIFTTERMMKSFVVELYEETHNKENIPYEWRDMEIV